MKTKVVVAIYEHRHGMDTRVFGLWGKGSGVEG